MTMVGPELVEKEYLFANQCQLTVHHHLTVVSCPMLIAVLVMVEI